MAVRFAGSVSRAACASLTAFAVLELVKDGGSERQSIGLRPILFDDFVEGFERLIGRVTQEHEPGKLKFGIGIRWIKSDNRTQRRHQRLQLVACFVKLRQLAPGRQQIGFELDGVFEFYFSFRILVRSEIFYPLLIIGLCPLLI